jgi:hypothetical protein
MMTLHVGTELWRLAVICKGMKSANYFCAFMNWLTSAAISSALVSSAK